MIVFDEEKNKLIIDVDTLYPIDSYKIKEDEVFTTCKILQLGLFDTSIKETFLNALQVSNKLVALEKEKEISKQISKEVLENKKEGTDIV